MPADEPHDAAWPTLTVGERVEVTGWITATSRPAPGPSASFEAVITPQRPRPGERLPLAQAGQNVVLIWLGQTQVPGLHPGATLRVSGPMSRRGGRDVMFNPRYEVLEPAPADKEQL